jgi:hypothetical protein
VLASVQEQAEPTILRAYDGNTEIEGVRAAGDDSSVVLQARARQITRVVLKGGGGVTALLRLTTERRIPGHVCYYHGRATLEPTAETGLWSTYLFVQTMNTVPAGTDPVVAAQTIGGLASSSNLVSAGPRDSFTHGSYCAIAAAPNGNFHVTKGS